MSNAAQRDDGRRFCRKLRALVFLTVLLTGAAGAHHSFAVFFNTEDKLVKVTGVVQSFVFSNPHGIVTVVVPAGAGTIIWKAETNSPSILRRRGWSPESMKVGDKVTLEGWAARDGSNYIRMRSAWDADGRPIGKPLEGP